MNPDDAVTSPQLPLAPAAIADHSIEALTDDAASETASAFRLNGVPDSDSLVGLAAVTVAASAEEPQPTAAAAAATLNQR